MINAFTLISSYTWGDVCGSHFVLPGMVEKQSTGWSLEQARMISQCTWPISKITVPGLWGKGHICHHQNRCFFFFSSFATFSLHLGIHISKLLDHGQMKYLFHPHRHFLKEHISLECSIRRICRQILLWH